MSWIRNHKDLVYRIAVGAAALSLTCFIWIGVQLYRGRKVLEAEIVARNHGKQCEVQEDSMCSFSGDVVKHKGEQYRCNNYVKVILCIGVDRSGNMTEKTTTGFGGQANGLSLIAQDTVRNTVKILMIPRDTMTDIMLADLSGNKLGKDLQHLNLAYAYGDGRGRGCEYMAEAVSELFGGLKIEWYMAADTSVIPVLNDEVGGVSVTIGTDGMESRDPALVKDETVILKGEQVEIFVRYRDIRVDHSAIYRMDQRQQYIKGFFEAAQKHSVKDSGLVVRPFDQVQEYIVTNMTKDQYLKVVVDVVGSGKLSDEDFYTVFGEGVVTPRYDEFCADKEVLTPILLELFYREMEWDGRVENHHTRDAVKYCNIQHGIMLFIEYNCS